jgi:hypothetical protein
MTELTWPTTTDDSGTLTDGSIINQTYLYAIRDTVNDKIHSSTNPTIKPNAITDEVVTARGSLASLDARLDVEHNNDGTHNLAASIVTTTVLATSLGNQNLAGNPTFLMWPDGDASAPVYYALSGAGATVARTGTGLSDTSRLVGKWGAKVTYGSATARLQQTLLDAGVWANADSIEGEAVAFTVWVKSSTVSQVRAYFYTGTAGYEYSSYHTGGGGWERLEVLETVLATATELTVGVEIAGTGNFVVSGFCPILGATATDKFLPARVQRGSIVFPISGTPTTGDGKGHFMPSRHMNITDVQIYCKTAPTGAFTIDVEIGDGTTWASIFATVISVDSGKEFAWQAADTTTYANTFVKPAFLDNGDDGAAGADQSIVRYNIDAVNAAADAVLHIRGWQYIRPLEDLLDYND